MCLEFDSTLKDGDQDKPGSVAISDRTGRETMSGSQKKENVSFLGIQKIPKGGALVLVNNEKGSTVTFDPSRHNIINMNGYIRFVIGAFADRDR